MAEKKTTIKNDDMVIGGIKWRRSEWWEELSGRLVCEGWVWMVSGLCEGGTAIHVGVPCIHERD